MATIIAISWKYIRGGAGVMKHMKACKLPDDQTTAGAQLWRSSSAVSRPLPAERNLRVTSDLFEASFETLCAALVTCNIEMRPGVTNDDLGRCSTAERG